MVGKSVLDRCQDCLIALTTLPISCRRSSLSMCTHYLRVILRPRVSHCLCLTYILSCCKIRSEMMTTIILSYTSTCYITCWWPTLFLSIAAILFACQNCTKTSAFILVLRMSSIIKVVKLFRSMAFLNSKLLAWLSPGIVIFFNANGLWGNLELSGLATHPCLLNVTRENLIAKVGFSMKLLFDDASDACWAVWRRVDCSSLITKRQVMQCLQPRFQINLIPFRCINLLKLHLNLTLCCVDSNWVVFENSSFLLQSRKEVIDLLKLRFHNYFIFKLKLKSK